MIKKRIFIASADERLRIALQLFLDYEPGMVVVGITDRLPGLIAQLEASQTDVLLLEWKLPFRKISDLLTDIHNLVCAPQIIFLSSKPEEKKRIIEAGADYFITKDAPPDELLTILNNIGFQKQVLPIN